MNEKQDPILDGTIAFTPPQQETPPLPKENTDIDELLQEFSSHSMELPQEEEVPWEAAPQQPMPQHNEAAQEPTVVPQPKRKRTTGWSVVWRVSKFVWRMALGLLLAAAILVGGLLGYLTVTEYNPAYAETADRGSTNRTESLTDRSLRILSMNTGYGGLGKDADFFVDGGKSVQSADKEQVLDNMSGIERVLSDSEADFIFLQEVDTDSARTYGMNQWLEYEHELESYESRFALNYSCDYVPYPLTDNIGKVHSGIATYSRYDIVSSTRYSLPNPFTWPTRIANLKRCLLVTRIPIEDSEQELVLINLHLEAYDDGEGKSAQTQQLLQLAAEEYAKGNYVICGGDFNQIFPNADEYPLENDEFWAPGKLPTLSGGWRYAYDEAHPTCRLLNQPYDPDSELTQYYVIDGFLVSPNVRIERVETLDEDFEYSDHNPVVLDFVLVAESETE